MAESKVNRENYIALQGWMLTDLKLKGNELIIYACIYGFSQAENQVFNGSLKYLADWTNSTKQGVIKCLKSLEEKGYIVKKDNYINGVKFCEYYTTKLNTLLNKVEYPIQQNLTDGVKQSLPNNKELDNKDNNKNNNKERKTVAGNSFDILIEKYLSEDGTTYKYEDADERRELLQEWLKVRKAKRAAMTDRAIELNLKKLNKLASKSNMSVTEYLQEVICRGWQAFFEIKNYNNQAAPRQDNSMNIIKQLYQEELDKENMVENQGGKMPWEM